MKSSTHYFHLKTKILADFQICISVPLSENETRFDKKYVSTDCLKFFLLPSTLPLMILPSVKSAHFAQKGELYLESPNNQC